MLVDWNNIYARLGVTQYVDFIYSDAFQSQLFVPKIVFIGFTVFFFVAILYFYFKSTFLKYKFLQDTSEFLLWQAYGLREIQKQWQQIVKRTKTGKEKEFRFALVEADDFLRRMLRDRGYGGSNFEEMVRGINKKILPNAEEILLAHKVRDSIVQDPNYALDVEMAQKMLADYEKAIKNVSIS